MKSASARYSKLVHGADRLKENQERIKCQENKEHPQTTQITQILKRQEQAQPAGHETNVSDPAPAYCSCSCLFEICVIGVICGCFFQLLFASADFLDADTAIRRRRLHRRSTGAEIER